MQRIGIVDLGSNNARMVVYAYEPGRWFRLVDEVREMVRLGSGLGRDGRLSPAAIGRGVSALQLFSDYAASIELGRLQVVGTSALRDAVNQHQLVEAAAEMGVEVEVLSGEEEARLGVLAVANGFDLPGAWVMDLGGGSAQLSRMRERAYTTGRAYPLGAIRLTEQHLGSDPPKASQVKALEQTVAEHLGKLAKKLRRQQVPLVAMGGTIRNIARIAQKRRGYPLDLLHGYYLRREEVEEVTELLLARKAKKRAKLSGINPYRADILPAGALVYRWLLRQAERDGLFISGHGLREGLLYRHLLSPPHLLDDVRGFSVGNAFARYEQPWGHTERVQKLARRLFDGLAPLHGLGPREAQLLEVAATLHDVGMTVSYYRHHKHGYYLVGSEPLPGFSHREQGLLMLLVRFHHRGRPRLGELKPLMAPGDKRLVRRLATCLRLAEHLEASRAGRVRDVEVDIGKKRVTLRLVADDDATVEAWETAKQGTLFQRAFGRTLELETVAV